MMITSAFWSPPSGRLSTPSTIRFIAVLPPQTWDLPGSPEPTDAPIRSCTTLIRDGSSPVGSAAMEGEGVGSACELLELTLTTVAVAIGAVSWLVGSFVATASGVLVGPT